MSGLLDFANVDFYSAVLGFVAGVAFVFFGTLLLVEFYVRWPKP